MSTAAPETLLHGDAILSRLPAPGTSPLLGAEIGVGSGELTRYLSVARPDLRLILVDSWQVRAANDPYRIQSEQVGDPNGTRNAKQVGRDEADARRVANEHGHRVIHTDSLSASLQVPDASLDFVFIDADHRYESCLVDCLAWLPKVKPGGWIGGHDIDRFRDNGVRRAVDEFARRSGLSIYTDQGWTWFAPRNTAGGVA